MLKKLSVNPPLAREFFKNVPLPAKIPEHTIKITFTGTSIFVEKKFKNHWQLS